MAELTTLARPYAKAAFEYAYESKQLELWSTALKSAAFVLLDSKVASLIDSPHLLNQDKAALITDICVEEFNDKLNNFVAVLATYQRLYLLPTVSEQFEQLKAKQEKLSEVRVTSAFALDSAVEKELAAKLKTVLLTDISMNTVVDPSLMGGIVIRTGDNVIDGSIKGRLNRLSENLGL